MKKLIIILIFSTLTFALKAQLNTQSLLSTAGDYFEAETITLSWSLGEIATETLNGSNITLTQGFQQTGLAVVGINKPIPSANISISVYPNPTTGIVNLKIINFAANTKQTPNRYLVFDIQGKLLINEPILNSKTIIDLQLYSGSVYCLKLINTETVWFKTFIVQKEKY